MVRSGRSIDGTLALVGMLMGIALIAVVLWLKMSPQYALIGALVLGSCSFWFVRGTRLRERELTEREHSPNRLGWALVALFFFLFTFSILIFHARTQMYERPMEYFLLIAAMVGVVAIQTMVARGRIIGVVLIQIILIGLNLAWSQLTLFPGLIQADPWYHQLFTTIMLEEHHIPEFSYGMIPLFHTLVGGASLILNVGYKTALMVTVSLGGVVILSLSTYLLGTFITGNPRVGLLAALILAISDYMIMMTTVVIPISLAAAFVPLILLMLLKVKDHRGTAVGLAGFFMVAVVLTHTIAAMWVAAFLSFGALVAWIVLSQDRYRRISTVSLSAFFITIMFVWWSYASGTLFDLAQLLNYGFSRDLIEPSRMLISLPVSEQLLTAMGMYLLFAVSLIGLFYLMSRRGVKFSFELSIIFAVPLAVGFISMVAGIFINQQRWFYFAEIFLAVPMAISLYLMFGLPSRRTFRRMAMGAFVAVVAFLMIMGGSANSDNHSLTPTLGTKAGPTEAELVAAHTSTAMWPHPAVDINYAPAFLVMSGYNSTRLDDALISGDFSDKAGQMVLIRENIVDGSSFRIRGGLYILDYSPEEALLAQGFSKVYDDRAVQGFIYT